MKPKPFVPLHLHTEYSLLDGATQIYDLVKKAIDQNMPAVAITDHGVMYGAIELTKTCHEIGGVKPIIGFEAYIIDGDIEERKTREDIFHLTLLARNNEGYRNLLFLNSRAHLAGYYYKPRINKELLLSHKEGLIVLSGCLGSQLAQSLLKNNYAEAFKVALWYKENFGENYYLEIQDHGMVEDRIVNKQLLQLSKELDIELVATNDSHFTNASDAVSHDCLLCVQMGKLVTDCKRMKFTGSEYIKNGSEMASLFSDHLDQAVVDKSIKNTLVIADKIEPIKIFSDNPRLPVFEVPQGHTSESFLNQMVFDGARARFGNLLAGNVISRAEAELKVIEDMNFASYFLIVADFIQYAKSQKIPVGPGRGSAAGSLVAYCLGITDIDPLKYNLLFERFLNPERRSMPDIDTDFCIERRDEVLKYVTQKYGADKVAQIITFNRMTSKAVIRDVSRVLEYPLSDANKLAKLVPVVRGKPASLSEMVSSHPEFKAIYDTSPQAKEVINIAQKLEGVNKTYGVHAAGVVISDVPLHELVPLQKNNDGQVITQYNMDDLAKVGLVKMDFLGLRNLTMIAKALEIIKVTCGLEIDISNIPIDDEITYQTISNGDLQGIFQLETSSGMRQVARDMKPSNIEDISALIALYRPGPLDSGMIDKFIACKHGKTGITYLTPQLESILKDTYGQIVYQEQVMQIAQKLANYSLGQADLLRRAMGKKKPEEMEKQRELFNSGCVSNGISINIANQLFDMMVQFAEYCFNKSHSQAYAQVTYQTAYLKTHYPVEYMTALLSSVASDQDKVQIYIAECQRMDIAVAPPDVNESGLEFTCSGKTIRFGLSAIKNVGINAIEEIITKRNSNGKFTSLNDFLNKIDLKLMNKRTLESLIKAGACSSLGISRKQALLNLEPLMDSALRFQASEASGQLSFLSLITEASLANEEKIIGDNSEFFESQIQEMEKELLGFYITSHPLARVVNRLKWLTTHSLSEVNHLKEGTSVIVGGLVSEMTKRLTKQNKVLGILKLEDLDGKVEVVIYNDLFESVDPSLLTNSKLLLISGKVKKNEENISIIAQSLRYINDASLVNIYLNSQQTYSDLHKIKDILNKFKGCDPVLIHFNHPLSPKTIVVGSQFWVEANDTFSGFIKSALPTDVRVKVEKVLL